MTVAHEGHEVSLSNYYYIKLLISEIYSIIVQVHIISLLYEIISF